MEMNSSLSHRLIKHWCYSFLHLLAEGPLHDGDCDGGDDGDALGIDSVLMTP